MSLSHGHGIIITYPGTQTKVPPRTGSPWWSSCPLVGRTDTSAGRRSRWTCTAWRGLRLGPRRTRGRWRTAIACMLPEEWESEGPGVRKQVHRASSTTWTLDNFRPGFLALQTWCTHVCTSVLWRIEFCCVMAGSFDSCKIKTILLIMLSYWAS